MIVLHLLPVILSALLIGAHFLRQGSILLVLLSVGLPLVLLVRRSWAARIVQAFLLLAALEWIRTLVQLASDRAAMGEPWLRMAIILALVAGFTASSALVFWRSRLLKEKYGLDRPMATKDGRKG